MITLHFLLAEIVWDTEHCHSMKYNTEDKM